MCVCVCVWWGGAPTLVRRELQFPPGVTRYLPGNLCWRKWLQTNVGTCFSWWLFPCKVEPEKLKQYRILQIRFTITKLSKNYGKCNQHKCVSWIGKMLRGKVKNAT